ncbi:BZ3500_MvSof-1268-A1-R1_Chr4-1g06653 [Microbotryum saponariae]|uniref:Peptide hydrolase n=1 Tax=Microbotryum saponariae TaxID=289078 RepID=A0A2X0LM96_9BASI|nr:BZ3500_MvSof-1268-A1-R1_Chr4-1g06653 [Microbotryum saponariae]SDA06318.1 BZ3501_MvSof-1269-A2-R1_Chr4-1g06363 [Microbotryum saponariae]
MKLVLATAVLGLASSRVVAAPRSPGGALYLHNPNPSSPASSASSSAGAPLVTISVIPPPECASFHARLGTRPESTDVYYLTSECLQSYRSSSLSSASASRFIAFDWSHGSLMWVTSSSLEADLLQQRQAEIQEVIFARQLATYQQTRAQIPLPGSKIKSDESAGVRLIAALAPAAQGRLVQLETDTLLREWTEDPIHALQELVFISSDPLPPPSRAVLASEAGVEGPVQGGELVSKKDRQRVVDILQGLKFNPLLSKLVKTLSKKAIIADVRYLSAEDQSSATTSSERWISRHSMSEGAERASDWLLQRFRTYGFICMQHHYKTEFAPMIECSLPGIGNVPGAFANETVVIGGHFDSRGSFGYPTAPGADDDGSGTALLLALARHISEHQLVFSRKIVIAAFSGEEQGLLGSNWYASELKKRQEDVVLMVQVDMIAYTVPGEPIQMARPDKIGLPEAAYLIGNVSEIYVPELQVGYTTACCSDHQSFEAVGYASTWVFERNGAIRDPCYHNSCDLSAREGYNFDQVHGTARAVLATLLEVGRFSFV